jgi:hypothetical protein
MTRRTSSRVLYFATILLSCVAAVVVACNDTAVTGTEDLAVGGGEDLSVGGSLEDLSSIPDGAVVIPGVDGGSRLCFPATCQGKTYLCGNCLDDDKDGRFDSDDPDCLGPCDNSENGLDPAIPGGNNVKCKMDCYFDSDTGQGNDNCYWDHGCDPTKIGTTPSPESSCAYNPTMGVGGGLTCTTAQQTQAATCKSYCGPLTPNGCDCFGCCFLGPQAKDNADGTRTGIWLGSYDASGNSTCTTKDVADPAKCKPCQMVKSCEKGCGKCQLCIGKDTLPPECFAQPDMAGQPPRDMAGADLAGGGGSDPTLCPPSLCTNNQPCGLPGCAACPNGWYCLTGCCTPPPG